LRQGCGHLQRVPPAVEGDRRQFARQSHSRPAGSVPLPLPLVETVKSWMERRAMRRSVGAVSPPPALVLNQNRAARTPRPQGKQIPRRRSV